MARLLFPVILSLVASAFASPLAKRCTNSATSRSCWGDYDINTDYYTTWPDTGNTVTYNFEITETTVAPDGFERSGMLINGQFPGPLVEAQWGDTIVVHVTNSLTNNGTSIHWHGIRQQGTNEMDGAVAVTQCPIAPGDTYTYTWKATQYGVSWYHSHFALQYSDGVLGPILIHGPSSADWDLDLGVFVLQDWFHSTAFSLMDGFLQEQTGVPPEADNGLINGKNTFNCSLLDVLDPSCVSSGERFETVFTPGKKHLLRLVNTGTDVHFRFSIDGHKLTVISNDFVPIKPYTTDGIFIAVGQRYEVIVEATKTSGNYWMRAVPQLSCLTINKKTFDIKGIVRYDASSTADPTTSSSISLDQCADESSSNLVPVVSQNVGASSQTDNFGISLLPQADDSLKFEWVVNTEHYNPNTTRPTLDLILENSSTTFPASYSVTKVDTEGKWVYYVIQSLLPLAHPFHLHGHDFYVLTKGVGVYANLSILPVLDTTNPPRRDVAILPQTGYLVIAFKTDNPGAWLMHCHIAWHLNQGLAMQLVESPSQVTISTSQSNIDDICSGWAAYDTTAGQAGA